MTPHCRNISELFDALPNWEALGVECANAEFSCTPWQKSMYIDKLIPQELLDRLRDKEEYSNFKDYEGK